MSVATELYDTDVAAADAPAVGGPDPLLLPPWGARPRLRVVRDAPARPAVPQAGAVPARWGDPGDAAAVTVLRPPSPSALAAPVHLTRRGVAVLSLLVGALALGLVWLAAASAPAAPAAPAHVPARVSVRAGDTLWSIASRVAPQRDPRAEVGTLQRLNRIAGTDLRPGQVLRTR